MDLQEFQEHVADSPVGLNVEPIYMTFKEHCKSMLEGHPGDRATRRKLLQQIMRESRKARRGQKVYPQ